MNVYDSSTEIADAGDISNHVKLLEVHCTFAHAIGVQNASGTGQFPSRTARIQQPKVVLTDGTVREEDWEFFLHSWSENIGIAWVSAPGSTCLISVLVI